MAICDGCGQAGMLCTHEFEARCLSAGFRKDRTTGRWIIRSGGGKILQGAEALESYLSDRDSTDAALKRKFEEIDDLRGFQCSSCGAVYCRHCLETKAPANPRGGKSCAKCRGNIGYYSGPPNAVPASATAPISTQAPVRATPSPPPQTATAVKAPANISTRATPSLADEVPTLPRTVNEGLRSVIEKDGPISYQYFKALSSLRGVAVDLSVDPSNTYLEGIRFRIGEPAKYLAWSVDYFKKLLPPVDHAYKPSDKSTVAAWGMMIVTAPIATLVALAPFVLLLRLQGVPTDFFGGWMTAVVFVVVPLVGIGVGWLLSQIGKLCHNRSSRPAVVASLAAATVIGAVWWYVVVKLQAWPQSYRWAAIGWTGLGFLAMLAIHDPLLRKQYYCEACRRYLRPNNLRKIGLDETVAIAERPMARKIPGLIEALRRKAGCISGPEVIPIFHACDQCGGGILDLHLKDSVSTPSVNANEIKIQEKSESWQVLSIWTPPGTSAQLGISINRS